MDKKNVQNPKVKLTFRKKRLSIDITILFKKQIITLLHHGSLPLVGNPGHQNPEGIPDPTTPPENLIYFKFMLLNLVSITNFGVSADIADYHIIERKPLQLDTRTFTLLPLYCRNNTLIHSTTLPLWYRICDRRTNSPL
jgi:hypothetical protein